MNRFRPYRNDDPPALASLWNRSLPRSAAVRPLDPHEFDAQIACKPGFDAQGLIVAHDDQNHVIGFVHAGFGPLELHGPSLDLDHEMGTIAMLVVDRDTPDQSADVALELVARAEAYLRAKGARVIYAGGMAPLNPFYWGVYGGSEFAGILADHLSFHRAVQASGFAPVSTTILYEVDLPALGTIRDPQAVLIRRLTTMRVEEDATLPSWWQAAAIGESRPNKFELVRKSDDVVLASAWTWEMLGFPPEARSSTRIGLIDVYVPPEFRRKGYGRHIVAEILRKARGEWVELVSVQTSETNLAARKLYESLNFIAIDSATLYRKAAL